MYKVEKYIKRCILSCLKQNLSQNEYEIICVNDGSPDNSRYIAESIAESHSNLKVVSRSNGGLSAARNTGISVAKGKYIFFVDSDDWIEENCLKKISDKLCLETPDVLCINAANVLNNRLQRRMDYSGYQSTSGPESMLLHTSSCAPFQIVRKAHLDEYNIRFYEGIYHEDVEYTPRMRYFAKKVCYMNDIIYYVYQNPESITRTINVKKIYDVINVVVPHIHKFAEKHVEVKYRSKYNEIIASAINTVLNRNFPLTKEDKQKVNSILSKNRFIYDDYSNTSLIKYKIEGLFFKIFPKHPVDIFYIMNFRFC